MRGLLAWLSGAAGGIAVYRWFTRERVAVPALGPDPRAGELRATFDRLPSEAKDAWIQWVGRARSRRARVRRTAYVAQRLSAPPVAETVEEAPPPLPPRQEWWPWLLGLALALLVAAFLIWYFG